jgi:DNA invertase Pin-like site-specific DNA recombinase/peptidoglycan hydrolase-like protein with peptidoglycan-binding domain
MTINLIALGNRATSITTVAVLGVVAVLVATSTPASAADARPTPVLAQGAGMGAHPSAQVRAVQRALRGRGYDLGTPGVDGRFGPLTGAAVRQMQADHGLAVDGIVGRHTRGVLGLTRGGVRRAQAQGRAAYRSAGVVEPRPTQDPSSRTTARSTGSHDATMELGSTPTNRLRVLLTVALGSLMTALVAFAVVTMRRQPARAEGATLLLSRPPLGAGPALRSHEGRARPRTIDEAPNDPQSAEARPSGNAEAIASEPACLRPGDRVIGYVTVSAEPMSSDDGSVAAVEALCKRAGWELLEIVRDREAGLTLERPALGYALERIADRQAEGLVVGDLQRLSRSIVDLGALLAWFRDAQATLVALDLGMNTSTAKGHRVATTLIALGTRAYERSAHRTQNAEANARNDGRPNGRPAVRHDRELLERIAAMRAANMTLQAIADRLNAERTPTLRGGVQWRPSSIQAALGYRRPAPRDHLPSLERRRARP